MQVPRIDGALVRITTETTRAEPSLGLSVGQRLVARVAAGGDGTALLEVAGRHLQARTAVALVAGQQVQLQVVSVGAELALRLLAGGGHVSEQQLALATLATAHQARATASPVRDLGALLRALEASVAGTPPADVHAHVSRLLGGLTAGADAAAIATQLQDVLENSGLLFESRVRAWLASQPQGAAAPTTPLPPSVSADLKVLLGVLGRALGLQQSTTGADASSPPVPGALRQALPPGLGPAASDSGPLLQGLRDAVLARQVEAAYHWVRDGTLAMDLPIAFDGTTVTAHLRFRRGLADDDRQGGSPKPGAPGLFIDFALEPPGVGPVRVQAHLASPQLTARFLVADPGAAGLIAGHLPRLREALTEAGITPLRADVVVDAAQAHLAALPEPALPRSGSVVDARA